MSTAFDAAPPNTHAGGDDDALRTRGTLPMNSPVNDSPEHTNSAAVMDMNAYRRDIPLWKRVHQHSLTQMMLISIQVNFKSYRPKCTNQDSDSDCRPSAGQPCPMQLPVRENARWKIEMCVLTSSFRPGWRWFGYASDFQYCVSCQSIYTIE